MWNQQKEFSFSVPPKGVYCTFCNWCNILLSLALVAPVGVQRDQNLLDLNQFRQFNNELVLQ